MFKLKLYIFVILILKVKVHIRKYNIQFEKYINTATKFILDIICIHIIHFNDNV